MDFDWCAVMYNASELLRVTHFINGFSIFKRRSYRNRIQFVRIFNVSGIIDDDVRCTYTH